MGEFSRIVGVFFEPKKAFEDIAKRPGWFVPMALVILSAIAVTVVIGQHIGWERVFRHQAETNARMQQLSPEQREQTVAMQVKFAAIGGIVGAIVIVPIYCLIVAAVLLGIVAGILSAPIKFKQALAAVCYGGLPALVSSLLVIVVMFLKNPDDFNLSNPLAFNVGAFLDPQASSKFVYSLATSIDLFAFWMILLVATGLKAAGGKKLSFGGALFAVLLPWAVVVLIKASFSGMFS